VDLRSQDSMSERYAGIEILEFVAEARNYNAWLTDLVAAGLGACRRVIDFGAGSGTFARIFRARIPDVVCIEPDAVLGERLRADGFAVKETLADVPAQSVPAVYSLNVLEHIEDDAAALRELLRVLVPGGRLVLFVPAFPILYSSFDKRFGHHRRYRRHALESLVSAAGFRVVTCRYGDSLGFFAALAFRLLDRGTGDVSLGAIKLYDRIIFPLSRRLDAVFSSWFGKNLYLIAEKLATESRA
jgi:SAM-dependent methyltransferase